MCKDLCAANIVAFKASYRRPFSRPTGHCPRGSPPLFFAVDTRPTTPKRVRLCRTRSQNTLSTAGFLSLQNGVHIQIVPFQAVL